jgi:hypothetical protein
MHVLHQLKVCHDNIGGGFAQSAASAAAYWQHCFTCCHVAPLAATAAAAAAAASGAPDNDGGPLKQNTVFYLPKVSRTLRDTYGRSWPGNPAEAEGNMYTKCWNSSQEIIVRMIDTCPCTQVGSSSSSSSSSRACVTAQKMQQQQQEEFKVAVMHGDYCFAARNSNKEHTVCSTQQQLRTRHVW